MIQTLYVVSKGTKVMMRRKGKRIWRPWSMRVTQGFVKYDAKRCYTYRFAVYGWEVRVPTHKVVVTQNEL
jgi:hypothetical protein